MEGIKVMATFTKTNLTENNYMDPVEFKVGRGKLTTIEQIYNFYDNKLLFLQDSFECFAYAVEQATYLPNLSVKFYDTDSLWWVIARFNGIIFPLSEIKPGRVLYIPSLSSISKALNKASNKSSTGSSHKKVIL